MSDFDDFEDDFDGDFGDDGFMDDEPFDDDLSGEEDCHEEPFEDNLPAEEHCQDEPDAPLTNVSGGLDWQDIALLGALSEDSGRGETTAGAVTARDGKTKQEALTERPEPSFLSALALKSHPFLFLHLAFCGMKIGTPGP